MRAIALLALLCASTALAPLAAAHYDHTPCGYSSTVATGLLHLDRYAGACTGLVVAVREDLVLCRGVDLHAAGVHVLVLYARGCQTGVIVETLRDDEAAVLP